ncbi:unnamed protein product, partial [Callosobruchus maculatus]
KKSRKRVLDNKFLVNIHGGPLPIVDSAKNLGVTLDTELRFSSHVSTCVGRAFAKLKEDVSLRSEEVGDFEQKHTDISTQTDITMEEIEQLEKKIGVTMEEIEQLEKKIEVSPFGLLENQNDTDKWKFYTGYEYQFLNKIIFPTIANYITSSSITKLSSFNQLLLTMIKLRLDLQFEDLAYNFYIAPSTASTCFTNVIDIMYQRFSSLIIWPDASVRRKNIPSCFKESFHDETTVILGCLEIFIEKPASFLTQQQCWSDYEHHHTVKFLIGITLQGTICYISKARGGQTSDLQMAELSNFCDKAKPGAIVIADRGFLVEDTFGIYQVKFMEPGFTSGKNHLHPLKIENNRTIADVRIHVERIIGEIRNKFNILNATIPISMLNKGNDINSLNILDKIVIICSALINLSPPVVPL